MKLIVHMIANAHLDPVWLWTWPSGLDEALATCRTACDLLDEFPDLYITRGEAWVYAQVQKNDPALFARVAGHVSSGRWQVVNGWWIQSDCNLPTAESFRKQGELGGRYFRENLGVRVSVGYNVDSFGHCATLPTFLRESGMDSYVFMRPQEHERKLSADLFTWQAANGDSVTAFHISRAYNTQRVSDISLNLEKSIADANREVGHTMCFFGVGDHGGGPTRSQIKWIREHAQYSNDVELRFSHPQAFFDAVKASGVKLPVVTGELQYHAIGCYSVVHEMKREMRLAENLAVQAERLLETSPDKADHDARVRLDNAWEHILFNQFHDILAGSSIRPAYEHARDELGLAKAISREILVGIARKNAVQLDPCPQQQLLLTNVSNRHFTGFVELEPWLGYPGENLYARLTDKAGRSVLCQKIAAEAAAVSHVGLLIAADIPPLGQKVIEVHYDRDESVPSQVAVKDQTISNSQVTVECNRNGIGSVKLNEVSASLLSPEGVRISAFEDTTDTWSHWIAGYEGKLVGTFASEKPWSMLEAGPLRATLVNTFRMDHCLLVWRVMLTAGDPAIRMWLRLHWQGEQKILKLLIPLAFVSTGRLDGCPGGQVERPTDGCEYPMHDFVSLSGQDASLAVVSADTFGIDVQPGGLMRVTLLRSPYYAHHDPFKIPAAHVYPATDQGVHEYEITLLPMRKFALEAIEDEANRQTNPVWMSETTRGMSARENQ